MTGQVPAIGSRAVEIATRCPACGRDVPAPREGRCPYCGERLHDASVTSDDHTPYAEALAAGQRAFLAMSRWVYRAGKQRLSHLALTRPSRASRRYATWSLLLLALLAGIAAFTNSGWHAVRNVPGASLAPEGKGWWQAVERSDPAASGIRALWWNLPWATVVGVATLALTLIAGAIVLAGVGRGAQRAIRGRLAGQPLLRCAVHYSTAWAHLLSLAAALFALAPAVELGEVLGWGRWSSGIFLVPAGVSAVAGMLLWWFWCVRLGQATPAETRSAATRYFVVWAPLWGLVLGGGLGYGAWVGAAPLAQALHLRW